MAMAEAWMAGRVMVAGIAAALMLLGGVASAQNGRPAPPARPAPATPPAPPVRPAVPAPPAVPATPAPDMGATAARTLAITPGQSVQGRLSGSDLKLDDESAYDTYTFEAEEGRQYRVLLASRDFDAVLFVLGDLDGTDPKVWMSDDLGDGITDSEVIFTAPTAGLYEILVNSYAGGETGRYRLALTWTEGDMRNTEHGAEDPRLGGRHRLETGREGPVRVVPARH